MSAGLNALASKVDFWEAEDKDEIAESIDDVRGMMRWVGRSPGADSIELTDEEAERSGSAVPGDLEILPSLGLGMLPDSMTIISGDGEKLGTGFEGGAGNGALAIREMGDRFWDGEGLALDRGDSGLCDGESCRRELGREVVCSGDGEICREPGAPGREATSDRAPR